jgi:hypothetical protein
VQSWTTALRKLLHENHVSQGSLSATSQKVFDRTSKDQSIKEIARKMNQNVPIIDLDKAADLFRRAADAASDASAIQKQFPAQATSQAQQQNVLKFRDALKTLTDMSGDLQKQSEDLADFAKAFAAGNVQFVHKP